LRSGQVQAISSIGRADERGLEAAGITLRARTNPGLVFNLALNNSKPALQDKAVRQAILFAVNRQEVVDNILPTGSRPATSILSHTTPGFADLGSSLTYDQAKATALLDAAGWKPGDGGIREKGGAKLDLTLVWFPTLATNQQVLELIQQQLKKVGIGLTLQNIPQSQVTSVQKANAFDAMWGNFSRADPDALRTVYSTKYTNGFRLSPSELDTVLEDQAATVDPDRRAQLVKQAQTLIVDNAYVVPVVEFVTEFGVHKNVNDLTFDASGRVFLHDSHLN
ncbi:ABC transporter substrate-binding protein, partial [Nocardia salmonicida]